MPQNIFSHILAEIKTVDDLSKYISDNASSIGELCRLNCEGQSAIAESAYECVLLRYKLLTELNFNDIQNRAFILTIFDLCERYNLQAAVLRLRDIMNSHGIEMNHRQQAALRFLCDIHYNSDYIERFDEICSLLEDALLYEEDDEKKVVLTLLNYYATTLDYSESCAQTVREKIKRAAEENQYSFLDTISIGHIDSLIRRQDVESLIDKITSTQSLQSFSENENILIENNTEYADRLSTTPCKFDAIRRLSVEYCLRHQNDYSTRGVTPPTEEFELYEYLKRYGNMHKAKILSALSYPFPSRFSSKFNIIDWGCGQGLATILFIEKYGVDCVNQIILTDASEIALARAALHCRHYAPNVKITTIHKKLDNLCVDDFSSIVGQPSIHLFSNILDIDDYSVDHLVSTIDKLHPSNSYFVCVSPYITEQKTAKVLSFHRYFRDRYSSCELINEAENSSTGDFWCCNNTYKNNGIVNHGAYQNCEVHDSTGCSNKWKRVMRVFRV